MKNVFIKCEEIVKVYKTCYTTTVTKKKPDRAESNSVSQTPLKSRS